MNLGNKNLPKNSALTKIRIIKKNVNKPINFKMPKDMAGEILQDKLN